VHIYKTIDLKCFSDFLFSAGKKVSNKRDELRELVEHFNVSFGRSFKILESIK